MIVLWSMLALAAEEPWMQGECGHLEETTLVPPSPASGLEATSWSWTLSTQFDERGGEVLETDPTTGALTVRCPTCDGDSNVFELTVEVTDANGGVESYLATIDHVCSREGGCAAAGGRPLLALALAGLLSLRRR